MPVIRSGTPTVSVQVPVPVPAQTQPKPKMPVSFGMEQPTAPAQPTAGAIPQLQKRLSAVILPWSPGPKQMSRKGPRRYSLTNEEDFHKLLDANPNDHHTRLVFADWLQEHDDPRAEGYRALGTLRMVPSHWNPSHEEAEYPEAWYWGVELIGYSGHSINHKHHHAILDKNWFRRVKSTHTNHRHQQLWKYHHTRREAEDAAALAFGELPHETKEEILSQAKSKLSRKGAIRYEKTKKLTADEKARARKVDLVVLPGNTKGTNCGNCMYAEKRAKSLFCRNKSVRLPVDSRHCCALWDRRGTKHVGRKMSRLPKRRIRYMRQEVDHEPFHAKIAENPREDTPSLVYADFLEENDMPHLAAFIREAVKKRDYRHGMTGSVMLYTHKPREEDAAKAHNTVFAYKGLGEFRERRRGRKKPPATVQVAVKNPFVQRHGDFGGHLAFSLDLPPNEAHEWMKRLIAEGHPAGNPERSSALRRAISDASQT